jgi:hypothetical protein
MAAEALDASLVGRGEPSHGSPGEHPHTTLNNSLGGLIQYTCTDSKGLVQRTEHRISRLVLDTCSFLFWKWHCTLARYGTTPQSTLLVGIPTVCNRVSFTLLMLGWLVSCRENDRVLGRNACNLDSAALARSSNGHLLSPEAHLGVLSYRQ